MKVQAKKSRALLESHMQNEPHMGPAFETAVTKKGQNMYANFYFGSFHLALSPYNSNVLGGGVGGGGSGAHIRPEVVAPAAERPFASKSQQGKTCRLATVY